jgi:hypothetical protein
MRGESMELSWSLEEREEEERKLKDCGGPQRGFAGARPTLSSGTYVRSHWGGPQG